MNGRIKIQEYKISIEIVENYIDKLYQDVYHISIGEEEKKYMLEEKILYHGSQTQVEYPEIRLGRFYKDFSYGFYVTEKKEQAIRWATRFGKPGILNEYSYIENKELNILKFEEITEEWLDFIIHCRSGKLHKYDIVEGPMGMTLSLIMYKMSLTERYPGQPSGN